MIDYAAPMMRVEKLLKEMHNDLLDKNEDGALEKATLLVVESKILKNTLVLMQERNQQHALRQQAETLQEGVSTAEGAG